MKRIFKDYILTILGTCLCGLGVGSFLLPNRLSSGGFSGVATVLYYFFGWNVGITVILLNIPLFIIAFIRIGRKFFLKTIFGTIFLSIFIDFFSRFSLITDDRFLSCIYGGVLVGIGTGFIFKANTSTGGSDLIVQIAKSFNVNITSGKLLNLIDIGVVFINVLFFKELEIGLYSAIAIFLDGVMIDIIFEGINFSKMIFIVSDKSGEVLQCLHNDINCGVTEFYGRGTYKEIDKNIIMTVVGRREVIQIKQKVHEIDDSAFIIVSNAREVYGLGFKSFE